MRQALRRSTEAISLRGFQPFERKCYSLLRRYPLVRSAIVSVLVVTLALSANSAGASAPDVGAVAPDNRLSSQACIDRLAAGLDCPVSLDAQWTGESECPFRVLGHRVCPGSPTGWADRAKLEAFAVGCAIRGSHMGSEGKALCAWVPTARLIISGQAAACRHEGLWNPFNPAFDAPVCLDFVP